MEDLIDRKKLLEIIQGEENISADALQYERYADMVKIQPSVDAVCVVRCKYCKFHHFCLTPDNYYCADGEREDGERDVH